MAEPYDYDLRSRVISLINTGNKRSFVSELLNISVSTVDRWIARYKESGDVKPRDEVKTGRKNIIKDQDKFLKFIQANQNLSLDEMQHKWKEASLMTIYRNLIKLGFSYKKNSGYIRKEAKKEGSGI